MLSINQYRFIKRVKDESPFTHNVSTLKYIKQVKWRMAQWYGINLESITDHDVYKELYRTKVKF